MTVKYAAVLIAGISSAVAVVMLTCFSSAVVTVSSVLLPFLLVVMGVSCSACTTVCETCIYNSRNMSKMDSWGERKKEEKPQFFCNASLHDIIYLAFRLQ